MGEETILAQEAHLREQAQKELAIAHINMESSLKLLKKKNEATMEKLKKLSDKLKEVEESRTYFPLVRKEDGKAFREAFNVLSEMQNLLNAKEKDHQEILKSYHKVSCAHAKLYHKVLDENKLINKLTEDRSSTSYGMVKFTEFTCLEIEAATKDSVCVGMGGYGKVYQALLGGTTVAIKIPKEGSNQGGREFNQEVEVLGRIQHQNLVTLIGACPELYALVYEFLPNGSLEDRLKDTKTFSWKERIKIAASICSALLFLHNMKPNPVAHGDLKPSNILFDSNNVCKLSDFGISRVLRYTNDTITPKHETMEPRGTYCYIDPEFLQTGTLTPQSDVFAFGIVLLQLVTAKAPMGLRNTILNALDCKNLEALRTSSKNKTLENFMDTNFVDPPIDDIMKITCLGLQCSDPLRKNRPDLETEVWSEIMSINGFASVS
ncbi:hypothetical protein LUZ62_068205 [Rhynchospora pubera]|uniref:RING-type E3 ubiquitin transferase n=1 Tax=Rhynchospora pubera TaxID=906938 RepID=A0AAV8CT16_9POAL|nr:hypothetical protein LUZ62_068205 [Rhynchospora pubera]